MVQSLSNKVELNLNSNLFFDLYSLTFPFVLSMKLLTNIFFLSVLFDDLINVSNRIFLMFFELNLRHVKYMFFLLQMNIK